MLEIPNVIPLAVLTAVAIFLIREVFEAIRRSIEKGRKLAALRRLLANECERNKFAIGRLRDEIETVERARAAGDDIDIEERPRGPRLTIHDGGELHHVAIIPRIHTAVLEKYLFEAASLNRSVFELMESTLDGLVDAQHVRESLIEYVTVEPEHLEGFADYGVRELDDAIERVETLYFNCTTEPLAKGRVR